MGCVSDGLQGSHGPGGGSRRGEAAQENSRTDCGSAGGFGGQSASAGLFEILGQEAYRVRVGDYRIIYTIHDDRLIVLVVDVGHRRDVYRR